MIDPRSYDFLGRFPEDSDHFWLRGTLYPLTVFRSRYGGTYEGGEWLAFNEHFVGVLDATSDDITCATFFSYYPHPIGRGTNANMAIQDLEQQVLELGGL